MTSGRELVCRKLIDMEIDFERCDNCLARVSDMESAPVLPDEQMWLIWEKNP